MVVASENLIENVLGACFIVHTKFGAGLLESIYEKALAVELAHLGIKVQTQVPISTTYRGQDLGLAFRADMIVEKSLLLELKATACIAPIHIAQTITYLKLLEFKRGFIINFHQQKLKDGIKRISI